MLTYLNWIWITKRERKNVEVSMNELKISSASLDNVVVVWRQWRSNFSPIHSSHDTCDIGRHRRQRREKFLFRTFSPRLLLLLFLLFLLPFFLLIVHASIISLFAALGSNSSSRYSQMCIHEWKLLVAGVFNFCLRSKQCKHLDGTIIFTFMRALQWKDAIRIFHLH